MIESFRTKEFEANETELNRLVSEMDSFGGLSPSIPGLSKESFLSVLDAHKSVFVRFMQGRIDEKYACLAPLISSMVSRLFIFHPASRGKHHSFPFGLQQHTTEVVRIGSAILEETDQMRGEPDLEEETVFVVAAMLHDIEKTSDYLVSYDHGSIRTKLTNGEKLMDAIASSMTLTYSDYCDQVRHISGGAITFNRLMDKLEIKDPFPDFRRRVTHALLSHHQLPEWGSSVSPKSRAAWALHLADMASVNILQRRYQKQTSDASNS